MPHTHAIDSGWTEGSMLPYSHSVRSLSLCINSTPWQALRTFKKCIPPKRKADGVPLGRPSAAQVHCGTPDAPRRGGLGSRMSQGVTPEVGGLSLVTLWCPSICVRRCFPFLFLFFFSPSLVLKGFYHYWTYIFSRDIK